MRGSIGGPRRREGRVDGCKGGGDGLEAQRCLLVVSIEDLVENVGRNRVSGHGRPAHEAAVGLGVGHRSGVAVEDYAQVGFEVLDPPRGHRGH